MQKTKKGAAKKPHSQRFKAEKRKTVDIEVDDRLAACARGDLDQIIHIGQVVESVLQGEFGAILRALMRGRSSMELSESRQHGGTISSDRYLGRLDAYEKIMVDLEQYVLDKDGAIGKLRDSQKVQHEVSISEEPGADFPGPGY